MATAEAPPDRKSTAPLAVLQDLAAAMATDPLQFVRYCWPAMKLFDKQVAILRSLVTDSETFVHAANECGKTHVAALAAIWFYSTRTPARVIVTSSVATQLRNVLWAGIEHLIRDTGERVELPFDTRLFIINKWEDNRTEHITNDYMLGQVTNSVEAFQGHHLPQDRPRVLAIFDEASGVDDQFYEAADSWAHRKLIIGNPLSTLNFFYRCCREGDLKRKSGNGYVRKVIHIKAQDSPNVQVGESYEAKGIKKRPPLMIPGLLTKEEHDDRLVKYNVIQRTIRLDGLFYEGDQSLLIPMTWIREAEQRYAQLKADDRLPKAEVLGVDVAWGGRDNTCWCAASREAVTFLRCKDTPDTMHMAGETIRIMKKLGVSPRRVFIDAGGGGKMIAQRLQEQGHRVQAIGFGEAADDRQQYKNRRAEMYGVLREWLDPDGEHCLALMPDFELRRELTILPLQYDSEGRLTLPPKRKKTEGGEPSIEDMLGRSPDRADALVLAIYSLHSTRRIPKPISPDLLQPRDGLRDRLEKLAAAGTADAMKFLRKSG